MKTLLLLILLCSSNIIAQQYTFDEHEYVNLYTKQKDVVYFSTHTVDICENVDNTFTIKINSSHIGQFDLTNMVLADYQYDSREMPYMRWRTFIQRRNPKVYVIIREGLTVVQAEYSDGLHLWEFHGFKKDYRNKSKYGLEKF